jgi:hypothetical protein
MERGHGATAESRSAKLRGTAMQACGRRQSMYELGQYPTTTPMFHY